MDISKFDHLRGHDAVRFREEVVDGETITIIAYMIADPSLWELPLGIECRGITFNSKGTCICWPLEKFFNVNEKSFTQLQDLDFRDSEFFEKRDGSMISPVLINNKIWLKTKKSFFSDVAVTAQSCWDENHDQLSRYLISIGWSPIFEFTHPHHPIVINYGDVGQFVLLGARNLQTGQNMPYHTLQMLGIQYSVAVILRYAVHIDFALEEMSTREEFEGYVILLHNGKRVKLKTDWYLKKHRIATQLRERDVAELTVDESLDDCKSWAVESGLDLEKIENIERQVVKQIEHMMNEVQSIVASSKDLDAKTVAQGNLKHPYFKLVMDLYRGKEPDYITYFKRHLLSEYSLKLVY